MKKKARPALAKNLKEVSEKLQAQANDIAADVYTSELTSKIDLPAPGSWILKSPEIESPIFRRDYSVMFDCAAAIAMASGFICAGMAIGMMR